MHGLRRFFVKLFGYKRKDEVWLFEEISHRFKNDGKLVFAGELLRLAYKRYPDNKALICQDKEITYKELYFRAMQLAKKMQAAGIKPRDKVILYCENSPAFFVSYFAIWQCSAVVIPLNVFLHEKELAYIIKDSEAAAIISSTTLQTNLQSLVSCGLINEITVFSEETIDWQTQVPNKIEDVFPVINFEGLDPDEMCVLLYTSGTTGLPKGVMLSSQNVLTNVMQIFGRFRVCGLGENEKFFCVLPLFHVFAQNTCVWLPTILGGTVIIVPKIDRKLILDGLRKKPTVFLGFPALYGLLCLMKTAPLETIKFFVSGADMLPDKIRAAFSIVYGRKICSGYGLTESSPVIAINYLNAEHPTDVVGYPLEGIECEIRNETEQKVSHDKVGTLWVKGGNVMMGYYKAPEATEKTLKNGWLNTGDLATLSSKGILAITGRSKDLIIHKGFNIYPAEIENVLMQHPAVSRAAVIGHDDAAAGQVPIAFIATKTNDSTLEADLRIWCTSNLAAYKIPRKFICMEELPMNNTGKVDKKILRNHI